MAMERNNTGRMLRDDIESFFRLFPVH